MAQPTRGRTADPSTEDASCPEPPRSGGSSDGASPAPIEPAPPSSAQDLAGALHEVSNALTVVVGWIERAQQEQGAGLARALNIAATRARDARRIIRRAIGADPNAIPGEGGDGPPVSLGEPQRTLAEVIEDALTGLEPEARRSAVDLRASIDPTAALRLVTGGATVVQILTNLLLNAVALSPSGSSVRIDARIEGDAAVIGVADQGPGVPPSRRATLLTAGISTRAGGAGIGLRHSAALAASAGGALTLAPSEAGARFELRWPVIQGMAAVMPREAAAAAPASTASMLSAGVLDGVRILIVEDDEAVVDLLDTALTARGASLVSVQRAGDLPKALAKGPFHIALLDISPIEQDVVGAVSAVRSANPAVRLVVMSGNAGGPDALPPGTEVSWVRKPFEIRELIDALVR